MPAPYVVNDYRCPAPCRGARRLLIMAISVSVLLVGITAADLFLRVDHQNDGARAWMKTMTLSAPALWPAGSPMRHPETVHPGVDLRFSPGLMAAP